MHVWIDLGYHKNRAGNPVNIVIRTLRLSHRDGKTYVSEYTNILPKTAPNTSEMTAL